jgi:hypothetical protein
VSWAYPVEDELSQVDKLTVILDQFLSWGGSCRGLPPCHARDGDGMGKGGKAQPVVPHGSRIQASGFSRSIW